MGDQKLILLVPYTGRMTKRAPVAGRFRGTFFGRVADLSALDALFSRGERLVTVTGPGGVGKTRLARHFADAHADEYTGPGCGGVWFCDLTEARTLEAVCGVVGETLDLMSQDAAASAVVRRLGEMMGRRGPMLVVFDNCEQVVAAAVEAFPVWLTHAPEARFLCT